VLKRKDALGVTGVIILLLPALVVVLVIIKLQEPKISYTFDPVVIKMREPVGIAHANDNRLFINERNGVIRILDKGALLPQPFLDLRDRVSIEGNIEQGLLSLAFDPNYDENGYFFVTYTDDNFDVHLERFQVSDDPNRANKDSSEDLLFIEHKTAAHHGSHLRFGTDGYLYMSVGDGGESIKPDSTGQRKDNLLGKILRLDVSGELPYKIPEDNPFVDDPDVRAEIWILGLRNPWHFSFEPDTDAMFIADVGWSTAEEINYQPANSLGGENYGWRLYEGDTFLDQAEDAQIEDVPKDELVFPIYFYPHVPPEDEDYDFSYPVGCALIGGFVYRGEALPQLQGKYLYGDFCRGQVWTLFQNGDQWETELLAETMTSITSFGEDVSGEIYITSYVGGVFKLILDDESRFVPEGDLDYDLIKNEVDNCLELGNFDQQDNWGDVGVGDVCDLNFYATTSSGYDIKIFPLHYGAFHIYGCEAGNCGFVANLESSELSKDKVLQIESENFTGWMVEATYDSDWGKRAVYNVLISDEDGNVYVDDLQIMKSETTLSWRRIDEQ
jgi:glucose/arabinose dehydrogenase